MTAEGTSRPRTTSGRAAALRALAALVASIGLAGPAAAQDTVRASGVPVPRLDSAAPPLLATPLRVVDPGPRESGRMLRRILAAPHVVLRGDTARALHLPRDTAYGTTVVVLGGDASIASRVRGDVVVIGGDLFIRPGARIEGRAVAFGGGVYGSALAVVEGEVHAYRDHTFLPSERAGQVALEYRDLESHPVRTVTFPLFGLQLPEYTRVDGLAVGWGPTITVAEGGAEFVPTVTYRSHLGAVDPRAAGVVRLGRRVRVRGEIGRATFSNDRWIRADLLNSFTTLVAGVDTRNYFRADRGEARVERVWETPTATYTPMVGARVEHAWSTGPDSFTTTAPFTITGRDDRERILRPNPRVRRGHVASALAGGRVEWESPQGFELQAGVLLEQAFRTPGEADPFTQFTGHVDLAFPTFGTQHFDLTAHAVASGGAPPPQRWAWLGGNGTILTLDLLELGGDQLAYVESRYHIPIDRVRIPIAGPPVITLRHIIGSAGVGSLPTLVQNVGARLTVAVVRLDYVIDPATRRSSADISFAMPF